MRRTDLQQPNTHWALIAPNGLVIIQFIGPPLTYREASLNYSVGHGELLWLSNRGEAASWRAHARKLGASLDPDWASL